MNIKEIANKIAELHYPNRPNPIIDEAYRKVRMTTLRLQVEAELSKLTTSECIFISKCDYGHKAPNKNDKSHEIYCAMKGEDWEK